MKKILSIMLSILMVVTMLPMAVMPASAASAAETCICTTKCIEGSVNGECTVCSTDGAELSACAGSYTYDEATNTYVIYNKAGLDAWRTAATSDVSTNLTLACDIEYNASWSMLDIIYSGTIDGKGYAIVGLNCSGTSEASFIYVLGSEGVIKHLGMVGGSFSNSKSSLGCGSAAFLMVNNGIIMGCYNTSSCTSAGYSDDYGSASGISYGNAGKVVACYNAGTISAGGDFGSGICDINEGVISGCYNTGAVSGKGASYGKIASAITSKNTKTINDCYYTQPSTGYKNYDSGIATNITKVTGSDWTAAMNAMNAAIEAYNADESNTVKCNYRYIINKESATKANQPLVLVCQHIADEPEWVSNQNGTHSANCDTCDLTYTMSCSGGTATCTTQAVCEVCGASYGELAAHTPDTNGKCTVDGCGYQYAAKVGDSFYETIHKALRAAEGINGCTLTLLDDVTLSSMSSYASYVNTGTFTLDLNGKNLSSNKRTLEVMGSADLTIRDSIGGGKIVSTDSSAVYLSGGKLNIESGTFEGTLDGVFLSGTSTLIVKGGTFTGSRAMITGFGSNVEIDLTAIDPSGLTLKNNGSGTFAPKLPEGYGMVGSDGKLLTSLSAEQSATVHKHEYKYTDLGDGNHQQACSCGQTTGEQAAHSTTAEDDKAATCIAPAYCSVCDSEYGDVDKNNHDETVEYVNGFCPNCDDYEPAVDSDSDGYYEIGNAGQLYWFADKAKNDRTNYGSANAILTQNIVVNENVLTADGKLNGFGSDFRAWIPPYSYKGTFDGAGKTVSGLYFKDTEERDVGFIGYLYGGTVKNLTVKDSYFNAYSAVGGIVGSVIEGTVTDCFSSATVIAGSLGYAGGIAGENGAGLVERCANSGFVTSGYEAGGIVGYNHNYYDDPDPAIIRHCYNIGSVSGYTVGGIVGFAVQKMGSSVEIDSCWAACELNGTNSVGGLIGHASGSTIRCCSYDKTVFTGNPVGKKTSCNILDSGFKSTEEFASGAAAYLLNGESSGGFWRQTIGTDAYPGFSGDKVYYGYISCADNAKKVYTNDATATEVKPAHNWSNNDGICANGCGYECTHVSYTGGVCDNCNYECPHAWGEGVLTRPVHDTVLGSKDGYYTYTCTVCDYEKKETVKSADYSAYEAVSEEINALLQSDELTDAAKQAIYSAANECGLPSNDLTESEQKIVDDLVAELEKIIADADEKIASGEYVKADYTEIDEAIDDIEEKLASENVTDEGKAELEEIKKQLEEMKADENTSEADLAELEKELEAYEEELDKGIEDGTLVEVDVNKIADEADKKWKERFEAEGLTDEYEDFINNQKATDEALAAEKALSDIANSLEGTVAENAENIAKFNEMFDYLFTSLENCLRGTHNFKDYEVTSPAKCEVNAIETRTCWFCGETDEREVEGTALEHSFTKYEETEAPKCGVAGKEVAYCDNGCQTTDERETPALEHIFLDYVSNGDATCTADGTKTASCLNGCGATDTVADEGSMLDHTDEDGDKLCDDCGEEVYDRCDICGGKAHGDDKIKLVFCMIITIIRFVTSILKSIN